MNNNRQSGDISLNVFGGLCAEISPSDLPEGASPLTWDTDFDVGAVFTRPGLTSVLSYGTEPPVGPNNALSIESIPYPANPGLVWDTPVNAAAVDGAYASVILLNLQTPSLLLTNYQLIVPIESGITGIEAAVTGHFDGASSPECAVRLVVNNVAFGVAKLFHLDLADGTTVLGGAQDNWGTGFNSARVQDVSFGVEFFAKSPGQPVTIFIDAITLKVYPSPIDQGPANINWLKTFVEDNGHTHTFVLDSAGIVWEEDVSDHPGILIPQIDTIYPNQFAASVTNQDEEWIAFSDLKKGTNIPRHGTNWDRISQVGPGAPPKVSGTSTGTNVWGIASITQLPAQGQVNGMPFPDMLWSQGPSSEAPGNTLTVFYRPGTVPPGPNPNIVVGQGIYLSGLSGDFAGLNGTYIVTDAGFARPPGASAGQGGERWMFTVHTVLTSPQNAHQHGQATGNYQPTIATLTLTKPATFQAGDQITIQGTGVGSWAGQWTLLKAINGGHYIITGTSLTNGVATYDFTLLDGALPTVGSFVTVSGCVNGPFILTGPGAGSSIFNVTQAPIASVTTSSFTINIPGYDNVDAAVENGSAIELGTVYQFDPGLTGAQEQTTSPTPVSSIFPPLTGGTEAAPAGGGTVSLTGGLTEGVRQAVVIFETRNGYLTAPSPPVTFGITSNDNSIACTNIPIGPPNVIARIIAFTPSNGANFFYIPVDVTIPNAGQPLTYTATRIADNVTTSKTFTFTDAVLMAATAIDIPGNDLFNQLEISSSMAVVSYAARNFYVMQNNKVQNLINTSFDGGYNTPGEHHYPAGWTPEANVHANNGYIRFSPVFGFSYYIFSDGTNADGVYGGIHQGAYQDAWMVPILRPNTTYDLRIDIRSPAGIVDQGGFLIIDVVGNPDLGSPVYGSAAFPLSSMSTDFQTLIDRFLNKGSLPLNVPTRLQLRLYASELPAGADIEIDRFEIYPADQPQLLTDVFGSYVGNLEAVDGISGDLGVGVQNNQPVLGGFVMFDIMYLLKTGSMFSVQDAPGEEPAEWKIREVSNKVGTCGIHAFDYGEEWMVTACRLGLYVFNGGEPEKIMQEIQPLWDLINWEFGHTVVVRNDVAARRIMVHVPLPTPNEWLPDAPLNPHPTTPNVMLMTSYKELQTSAMLAERGPVKLSYSGRLITWDLSRKWSIWQIPSPYSAFITRPDGSDQDWIGNGRFNSKIYELDSDALSDDGIPIHSLYTTYGFVRGEQAQQFGPLIGQYRKLYRYSSYNVSGAGLLKLRALRNDLNPPYPYEVPGGIRLTNPIQENREVPYNLEAQRLYLEFSTNAADANFRLSEIILSTVKSPSAPVRGLN